MKIKDVLPIQHMQTEADAADAQLQSIKQREKALKVQKAQAKANKALQQLHKARSLSAKAN